MKDVAKDSGVVVPLVRLSFLIGLSVVGTPTWVNAQGSARPGKPHELLAMDAGTWDCKVMMFFGGPNARPEEFDGVEVNQLVSGGLYLQTSFTHPMGRRGEFEGHSLIGYDPRVKKYVGTWVDNRSAIPRQIAGDFDEMLKTLTIHSIVVDGRGRELKTRQVTRWLDESNKKLEVFMVIAANGDETEIKLMEMTATKR
jgi:hypothetical protein